MKYAGLMKPPPQMTRDVYDYVISQVASNYVHALKKKLLGADEFRKTESKQYQPLLKSIKDLRNAVAKGGTREIFQAYKEFASMSSAFFGLGYADTYKMKVFSGVQDPKRRSEIKELVERHIERNLLAMENRLSYFEKRAPRYKKLLKDFQALVVEKLPPMEGREETKRKFPIEIDDWYLGQQEIEEHQELFREKQREKILLLLQDNEERFRRFGHLPNGGYDREYYEEKKNNLNRELDAIDKGLSLNNTEYLGEIVVEIGYEDTSFWMPTFGLLHISIENVEDEINRGLNLDAQRVANGVHRKVVHEMTHVGQTILSIVKSKITDLHRAYYSDKTKGTDLISGGLPSKSIRTPEYAQGGGRGSYDFTNHNLDDVEFYTDLRDAMRLVMFNMRAFNPQTTREKNALFKSLVGIDMTREERRILDDLSLKSGANASSDITPFFHSLKKLALPKWRKAVGEAYKLAFNTRSNRLNLNAPSPRVEPPKARPPRVEPRVEPPRVEPPRVEPPRVEPPRVEPPKAQPPKARPPKARPPKARPPRVEPPRVEPRVEPPRVEPRVEPPRVEPRVEPPRNEVDDRFRKPKRRRDRRASMVYRVASEFISSRVTDRYITDLHGHKFGPRRGLEGPFRYKNGMVLYYDRSEAGGTYYNPRTDMYLTHDEAFKITQGLR